MSENSTEFTIRPNSGFDHRSWRWLLALLIVVSLVIAVRFASLGFWMILPFTILELIMVVLLTELVRRRGNFVEKVVIQNDSLEIYHLEPGKNRDWAFPLHWAKVELTKPAHRWYPHRLRLGSYGQWVEIGQCLTEDERLSLADAIKNAIRSKLGSAGGNHA